MFPHASSTPTTSASAASIAAGTLAKSTPSPPYSMLNVITRSCIEPAGAEEPASEGSGAVELESHAAAATRETPSSRREIRETRAACPAGLRAVRRRVGRNTMRDARTFVTRWEPTRPNGG